MKEWFSAKLSFAHTSGNAKQVNYWNSVFVFKAGDFDEAFKTALEIGRAREEKYWNVDGELTSRQLVDIETLDRISGDLEDGSPVYVETAAGAGPVERRFDPEAAKPRRTL
jgi:hypothetical protein